MTKHQAIDRINQHLTQMDEKALEGLLLFLDSASKQEDDETSAVLKDHSDILERVKRLDDGTAKTIPIEDVAKKYGVKL
ncbi:MAG: hypothetical protein ACRCYY_19760 [Trueperaceae bacterium]